MCFYKYVISLSAFPVKNNFSVSNSGALGRRKAVESEVCELQAQRWQSFPHLNMETEKLNSSRLNVKTW